MEQILSLGFMASSSALAATGCEQFCSRAFRHRDRIAAAGTAIFSIILLLALQFFSMAPLDPEPEPMPIELVDLPPLPKEAELIPEKPLPPPPKASVQVKPQAQQPAPQIKPTPALSEPAPALPVQPQQAVEPPKAAEPPTLPQPPRSNPAAESGYQARARAEIDKQKRYPEEAQQLGMSGTVLVNYTIARDGRLLRAEIAQSSGFKLLDQAALQAVQRTRFETMPADAWTGAQEQSFRTRIAFTLD